jgi:hypothetical protein
MAAHNDHFPWLSYYENYDFFEQRMHEHSKVLSCENIDVGLYDITLLNKDVLRVFICECYSFSAAEYVESCQKYGDLDAVVISSNWCGYSYELKRDCMMDEVGIYDVRGFMAAINKKDFWSYLTKSEREKFKEYGWL